MAKKELISPQDLKLVFAMEDHGQMLTWLRDYCHKWRRGNSYHLRVVRMLVERGHTVCPNFMRGQSLRYEDPNFQIKLDGTVTKQTPGPYSWTHVVQWMHLNGYTLHREFMFDADHNKYLCLGWRQCPNWVEVLTNKGLMFADPKGVLRAKL